MLLAYIHMIHSYRGNNVREPMLECGRWKPVRRCFLSSGARIEVSGVSGFKSIVTHDRNLSQINSLPSQIMVV
jgi:hypothetical protein